MIRFQTGNVWFNLFGFFAGCILIIWLPRRLPRTVSALVMMMSLALSMGFDHSIGVRPIDLYDTNIKPWLTLSEVPTWGMYAIFGYLFVYLYDKWSIKGLAIPFFVLGWSMFAAAFEALTLTFGVFVYKGWALPYSFLVYVSVQLLTVVVFRILMRVYLRSKMLL